MYTLANTIPADGPATNPYAFGSLNNNSPAFGASDPVSVTPSPFKMAPINPFAVDGAFTAIGSTVAPYRTTQTADGTTFQTITAMPQYEQKSLEELRLEDYMVKNKSKKDSSEKRRIRSSAKPLFEAASASEGAPVMPPIYFRLKQHRMEGCLAQPLILYHWRTGLPLGSSHSNVL